MSQSAKTTLNSSELRGAIAFAKEELRKDPNDPTLKSWLTIIAQREVDNADIRSQLDELKDFLDAQGKRIIPAPIFDSGTAIKITPLELSKNIKDKKSELDASLEIMTMENLESSLKLTETLIKLAPDSHATLARGIAGSMILGRLQELGYHISITREKKVVVTSNEKNAKDVENKINTFLAVPDSPMLDIIRIGTLYMSPTFQQYAESKSKDEIVSPPQKPEDYKKYLVSKYQNSAEHLSEDKAFIDSFNKGGYAGYDLTLAMMQSKDLGKVAAFVDANPRIVSQIQSTPPIAPVSTPTTSLSSAPATTSGKAAGVVGEGIGTIAGGIGKVVGTVASETASTWSTILSEATKTGGAMGAIGVIGLLIGSIWNFGFWETMMGVVGIGGASAIANAAEDGTFNKLADKMKKGGDKLGSALDKITGEVSSAVAPAVAVVAPAVTVANGVNLSNLSEQQKKGMDFVMGTSSRLPKMIEDHANKSTNTNEKGKVADYINFIHSQGFQAIPLGALIYNTNSNITIFRDDNNYLDPSIASLPEAQNLNKQLLKKVLRMYILGKYAISLPVGGKKEGDKELEEFKTKYPETTNKDKKFSDFIKEIHK